MTPEPAKSAYVGGQSKPDNSASLRTHDCPDCDGSGVVFDHRNYWGKAEDRSCGRCDGRGLVAA